MLELPFSLPTSGGIPSNSLKSVVKQPKLDVQWRRREASIGAQSHHACNEERPRDFS
uniref:Uncharacterized protein n=1 Tax=Arundo donax TaxID=35708 RepID=A0A0A9G9F0_ARUDO